MKIFKSLAQFISANSIWMLILVYVYVRSFYWNLLPIWDGMLHYSTLLNAIESPFDILNYSRDGHICEGFLLFMGMPYLLYRDSYYAFNIWMTLFSVGCIVGFYNLLLFFLNGRLRNIEVVLITALFAFHPSVLSGMTHFTLDMGVLTFFILYWVMLLNGKRFMAFLFVFLLLFTKETAMLLVPLPFLFCWLIKPSSGKGYWLKEITKYFYLNSKETDGNVKPFQVWFRSLFNPLSERMQWLKKNCLILIIPYLFLGLFMLYKMLIRHQPAMWDHLNSDAVLFDYFNSDRKFINYLGLIFIINFNWVLTLLWIILLLLLMKKRKSLNDSFQTKLSKLFILFFLTGSVVLTLVVSWSNARYVMLLIPCMLLAIGQLASVLIPSSFVRISVVLLLLIVLGFEDVRTIDPVSKAFFGTINFGRHQLINTCQRTDEDPIEYGRDQLVYNLEYLKFRQILNKIFIDIRPSQNTCFVLAPMSSCTDWTTISSLDSNYMMTYKGNNLVTPKIVTVYNVFKLPALPKDVYFIELPFAKNSDLIEALNKSFPLNASKIYDNDGYQINVIHYKRISSI